jgi:hypothetical protein
VTLIHGSSAQLQLLLDTASTDAGAYVVVIAVPRIYSQDRIIIRMFATGIKCIRPKEQHVRAHAALVYRDSEAVQALVAKKKLLVRLRPFALPTSSAAERTPNAVGFAEPWADSRELEAI